VITYCLVLSTIVISTRRVVSKDEPASKSFVMQPMFFLNLLEDLTESRVLTNDGVSIYRNFHTVLPPGTYKISILPAEIMKHKPRVHHFLEPVSVSRVQTADSGRTWRHKGMLLLRVDSQP
jgi:hypothetical protein